MESKGKEHNINLIPCAYPMQARKGPKEGAKWERKADKMIQEEEACSQALR
jgi:hypothetical protein